MSQVLITYATSEGSGEPVRSRLSHRCSLIQYRRVEEASDKEPEIWPHWIAAHTHLKEHKPHNTCELAQIMRNTTKLHLRTAKTKIKPVHLCSLISLHCLYEEALDPWLPIDNKCTC